MKSKYFRDVKYFWYYLVYINIIMNEQMMILMIFQFRLGKKIFDKKKYQQKL